MHYVWTHPVFKISCWFQHDLSRDSPRVNQGVMSCAQSTTNIRSHTQLLRNSHSWNAAVIEGLSWLCPCQVWVLQAELSSPAAGSGSRLLVPAPSSPPSDWDPSLSSGDGLDWQETKIFQYPVMQQQQIRCLLLLPQNPALYLRVLTVPWKAPSATLGIGAAWRDFRMDLLGFFSSNTMKWQGLFCPKGDNSDIIKTILIGALMIFPLAQWHSGEVPATTPRMKGGPEQSRIQELLELLKLLFTSVSGVSSQPRLLFAPAKVLRRPKPWVLSANKAQSAALLQILGMARWDRRIHSTKENCASALENRF